MFQGRFPGFRLIAFLRLPALFQAVALERKLLGYSCGGSHGIGPLWVRLTMFPFNGNICCTLKHGVRYSWALESQQVLITGSRKTGATI